MRRLLVALPLLAMLGCDGDPGPTEVEAQEPDGLTRTVYSGESNEADVFVPAPAGLNFENHPIIQCWRESGTVTLEVTRCGLALRADGLAILARYSFLQEGHEWSYRIVVIH